MNRRLQNFPSNFHVPTIKREKFNRVWKRDYRITRFDNLCSARFHYALSTRVGELKEGWKVCRLPFIVIPEI